MRDAFPTYGKAAIRMEYSPMNGDQIKFDHYQPNMAQENWQLHANGKWLVLPLLLDLSQWEGDRALICNRPLEKVDMCLGCLLKLVALSLHPSLNGANLFIYSKTLIEYLLVPSKVLIFAIQR